MKLSMYVRNQMILCFYFLFKIIICYNLADLILTERKHFLVLSIFYIIYEIVTLKLEA